MTLHELAELYVESRKTLNYSAAWFTHHRLALQPFLSLNEVQDIHQLTPGHLQKYRVWLYKEQAHLTPSTLHHRFAMVLRMLRWATERSLLVQDPGSSFLAKRPPYRLSRFVPSCEQMEQLLRAPDESTLLGRRDRFIWELFYGTGLRRQEAVRLQINDYQRESQTLWVRLGKGQKDRLIPLGDRLIERLEDYLENIRPCLGPAPYESALIIDVEGGRLSGNSIWARLQIYAQQLELQRLAPHTLRHAYASHLLEGGAQLHEVRRLLGHSCVSTTEVYTRIHPQELLRVYRRTHPRARRRRR